MRKKREVEEDVSTIPLAIERPDDTQFINMILYGVTGVGKTHLCGTVAEWEAAYPCLLLDIEGGSETLRGMDIDIVRPRTMKDIADLYEWLLHENTKYRSIIVDSLTELQRKLSLGSILGTITDAGSYKRLDEVERVDRQDYGSTGAQMRDTIRAFRDLAYHPDPERRVHVLMTALETRHEDSDTVHPDMIGKLGIGSGAFVDVVGRLSVQAKGRHLLLSQYVTEDGTTYIAKNRGDRLGMQMWNPTIKGLFGGWASPETVEHDEGEVPLGKASAEEKDEVVGDD